MTETAKSTAPQADVAYTVMDTTCGPAGNSHEFINAKGKVEEFKFEKGVMRPVPEFVALKCGEINRKQPDNPPFVIHRGDGVEIDTDAFDETTIEKIIDDIRLSMPKQADALQKKLNLFAEGVQRQLVALRTDMAKKDDRIADLEAAAGGGGASLDEGQVVAELTDLMGDALKARAEKLPGFERLGANPNKATLVAFLKAALWPKAETETDKAA